jgi:membrane protein
MKLKILFNRLTESVPVQLLVQTIRGWQSDNVSQLAASLAYYMVFSIAPLLLLLLALIGLFTNQAAAESRLLTQIGDMIGQNGAGALRTMIQGVNRSGAGSLATLIAIVTLVAGATGVFTELQSSLDAIWHVAAKPHQGLLQMVRTRLLAFAMLPFVGLLLLVSLLVNTSLAAVANFFSSLIPNLNTIYTLQALNFVLSVTVFTLLFAMLFKVLPSVKIAWSDVWIGGAVTAFLFTAGQFLISLYLANSSTASAYGAAGSLIVILLWVYYSAQILFIGAEFTQVYARLCGSRIEPDKHAYRRTDADWPRQGERRAARQEGGPDSTAQPSPGTPAQRPAPPRAVVDVAPARRATASSSVVIAVFAAGVVVGLLAQLGRLLGRRDRPGFGHLQEQGDG